MLGLLALALATSPPDAAQLGEFTTQANVAVALVDARPIPAKKSWKLVWAIDYDAINAAPPVGTVAIRSNNQPYNTETQAEVATEHAPKIKDLSLAAARAQHKAMLASVASKKVKIIEVLVYGGPDAIDVVAPRTAQLSLGFLEDGSAPTPRRPSRFDASKGKAASPQIHYTTWYSSF